MMMSSNFLETSGDGDGAARFGRMPDDWMNGIDTTTMPFSGLDAPYEASTVSAPSYYPDQLKRDIANQSVSSRTLFSLQRRLVSITPSSLPP